MHDVSGHGLDLTYHTRIGDELPSEEWTYFWNEGNVLGQGGDHGESHMKEIDRIHIIF